MANKAVNNQNIKITLKNNTNQWENSKIYGQQLNMKSTNKNNWLIPKTKKRSIKKIISVR